jgi:WD40 repeat protein
LALDETLHPALISVKLWDVSMREGRPLESFHEHKKEVQGVSYNLVSKETFVSASWDSTLKLWSLSSGSYVTRTIHVIPRLIGGAD